MESVLAISIVNRFLTDYIPAGDNVAVRNFRKIAFKYLYEGFATDLIPIIPTQIIFGTDPSEQFKLLCIIKMTRLRKGLQVLNIPTFRQKMKEIV